MRSTVVEAADQPTSFLVSRHWLQPRPSPRCAARASPVRHHHRARTVRVDHRRSKPDHVRTPCAFRHSSSCFGCGCTPFGRAPSTRALLGPACKETWDHLRHVRPSRRSQVVVRRGQRWWRQMPQGSSTRSSLQSIADMGRRAQCPPSMQVSQQRRHPMQWTHWVCGAPSDAMDTQSVRCAIRMVGQGLTIIDSGCALRCSCFSTANLWLGSGAALSRYPAFKPSKTRCSYTPKEKQLVQPWKSSWEERWEWEESPLCQHYVLNIPVQQRFMVLKKWQKLSLMVSRLPGVSGYFCWYEILSTL